MKASEYYKTQPVNNVNQKWLSQTEVEISIYKRGWSRSYKFKAKKLYEKDEQILEDEEVDEAVR